MPLETAMISLPAALKRSSAAPISRSVDKARAGDVVGLDDDAFDVRIVRGRVDGAQDVAQLHFAHFLAEQSAERALRGVGRVLLDDVAFRIEHQRGVVLRLSAALVRTAMMNSTTMMMKMILKTSRRAKLISAHRPDEKSDEPPVLPFRHGNFLR